MQRITEADAAHCRAHGYAIVENFPTAGGLTGALGELQQLLPGSVGYCQARACQGPLIGATRGGR